MSDIDTQQYKQKLEEEKELLEKELSRKGHKINDTDWVADEEKADDSEFDPTVQANRVEDYGERVATLTEIEIRLDQVVKALERIENGTYGNCMVSGKPIEKERLDANPAAETCIEHMEQA